jgi:chromosome segregation ATPase
MPNREDYEAYIESRIEAEITLHQELQRRQQRLLEEQNQQYGQFYGQSHPQDGLAGWQQAQQNPWSGSLGQLGNYQEQYQQILPAIVAPPEERRIKLKQVEEDYSKLPRRIRLRKKK